jgi:hypothetical protein
MTWRFIPPALVCWLATSCGYCSLCAGDTDDEQQIRALIEQAADAAERHDLGAVMDLTAEDVRVRPRNLGRKDIKRYLFVAFRRYGNFSLLYPRPDVEIEPDARTARAGVAVLLVSAGQSTEELDKLRDDPETWLRRAGDMANLFRMQIHFAKKEGDWLVQDVRLEGFRGFGFGP